MHCAADTEVAAMNAIDRALRDIAEFERCDYINAAMAQRAREVIDRIFAQESVYCSVAPDDGGVTFYWRAGRRQSVEIDLFPPGEDPSGDYWYSIRNNGGKIWACVTELPWGLLAGALSDFSAYVERENPKWREQTR